METIKAKTAVVKWELEQGVDFNDTFTYKVKSTDTPIDLTGYTARMKIKANRTDTTHIDELTTENARIVLGGAAGTIQCIWTAAQTAAYDFDIAHYDLEIIAAGGQVTRLMRGQMHLSKEITD